MVNLEETLKEINKLRFGKLIQYDEPQNQSYGTDIDDKGKVRYVRSALPTGVCNLCKKIQQINRLMVNFH